MDKEKTRRLALRKEWFIRFGFVIELFLFMGAGFVYAKGIKYFWYSFAILIVGIAVAVIVGDWIKDQSILMYKGGLLE